MPNTLTQAMDDMLLEVKVSPQWDNTVDNAVLIVVTQALVSLLQSSLRVSNELENPENLDPIGYIDSLCHVIDWIMDNSTMESA